MAERPVGYEPFLSLPVHIRIFSLFLFVLLVWMFVRTVTIAWRAQSQPESSLRCRMDGMVGWVRIALLLTLTIFLWDLEELGRVILPIKLDHKSYLLQSAASIASRARIDTFICTIIYGLHMFLKYLVEKRRLRSIELRTIRNVQADGAEAWR